MPDYAVIQTGSAFSPPVFLSRGDQPLALFIPASVTPTELRLQLATSSGAAASGDAWGDWQPPGNAPGAYAVWSGGNNTRPVVLGPLGPLPTPFVRVFMTSSATLINTFTLLAARTGR